MPERPLPDLPKWVWDILADLVRYEDVHTEVPPCLDPILCRVPANVRATADVIARYREHDIVDAEIVEDPS